MINLAPKKINFKNLKKQRWAVIMAAVLALGMIISLVGSFIVQSFSAGGQHAVEQHPGGEADPGPEDYLAHYNEEAHRLEEYLAENEPTEAILLELISDYHYLAFIHQVFFEDEEAFVTSQSAAAKHLATLVEMYPQNAEYRYELIDALVNAGADQAVIGAEAEELLTLLREEANPRVHLALTNLLASGGNEELVETEVEWLKELLQPRYVSGQAANEDKFLYAYLAGEYLDQKGEALEILQGLLQDEPEDSALYHDAAGYLDHLQTAAQTP